MINYPISAICPRQEVWAVKHQTCWAICQYVSRNCREVENCQP